MIYTLKFSRGRFLWGAYDTFWIDRSPIGHCRNGSSVYKDGQKVTIEDVKVVRGSKSVIVLFSKLGEAYPGTKEDFEVCKALESAEYASEEERLTDITAYLEEINGLENFLTSLKTSRTSAGSATCREPVTPTNTAKNSSGDKWRGLDANTWIDGSLAYHLEPDTRIGDSFMGIPLPTGEHPETPTPQRFLYRGEDSYRRYKRYLTSQIMPISTGVS